MCGGDNPETKMEHYVFDIAEEYNGIWTGKDGNLLEFTAEALAKELGTSAQIAGKVMSYFEDLWYKEIRDGKVMYIPQERF
jgi:hypothetical protein